MDVWNILFPEKCVVCGSVLKRGERGVCGTCRKRLPQVSEPVCRHCGKPVPGYRQEYCTDCAGKKSNLTQGLALWEYTDKMKRVMANFKYGGSEEDALFFAEEMVREFGGEIRRWKPEAIFPVPLHRKKLWFRGYNQAESLADELGRLLKIQVLADVLIRTHYTVPQKGLDAKQRRKNLAHAFSLNEKTCGKLQGCSSALLVDDIYTTGATLEACAAVLRGQGIKKVYFLCVCTGKDY